MCRGRLHLEDQTGYKSNDYSSFTFCCKDYRLHCMLITEVTTFNLYRWVKASISCLPHPEYQAATPVCCVVKACRDLFCCTFFCVFCLGFNLYGFTAHRCKLVIKMSVLNYIFLKSNLRLVSCLFAAHFISIIITFL